MVKALIGGVVLATLAAPAMATEYWVQYDYTTHTCSIIEKKTAGNPTDTTKDAATPNPTADATASNTPKDNPVSDTPQGFAAPTQATPPVVVSRAPSQTPSTTPSPTATKNPPAPGSATGAPNGAAAPGAPQDTSSADKKDDPFAPLAAAWAAKKAAAEANGTANITRIEIGTAMQSREDAEAEMLVMRKCGLKN